MLAHDDVLRGYTRYVLILGLSSATDDEAAGSLRGKINILSLRTCKADVCVGLVAGKSEELDVSDPTWRVSGK